MKMSDKLHALAALPPTSIKQESGWATETVLTFQRRRRSMAPAGIGIPDRPVHNLDFCTVYFKIETHD